MNENLVGKKVVVTNKAAVPELIGSIGKVINIAAKVMGLTFYIVEFTFEVGKFTRGGEPGRCIAMPDIYLKVYEEPVDTTDYDTLINLALDTKDESWFNDLLSMKNNGIKPNTIVFDEELKY